ncbi:MAG: rhodanese-like domain-containing protein [Gaiellales bacterium]
MEHESENAPDLTPAEAQEWQRARALMVDVRELDEWEAGRIPGSVHLPLSELAERWQELPDADQTVFICRVGGRSRTAADAFSAAGRKGCANLAGGCQGWVQAGLPFDGHVA